jgi:electron transport complex protein RnfG
MKASLKLVGILFLVCGIAAGSLAFVNAATKDRIAAFAREEQLDALKNVLPEAQSFKETGAGKSWEGVKGGEVVGYVEKTSIQGYSGPIVLVFGVDLQGKITGVRVLSHTETPGLGAKITTAKFLDQYKGKTVGQVALKKDDPAGGIDAISAATISSRALTRAVRQAMEAEETSGASAAPEGGD